MKCPQLISQPLSSIRLLCGVLSEWTDGRRMHSTSHCLLPLHCLVLGAYWTIFVRLFPVARVGVVFYPFRVSGGTRTGQQRAVVEEETMNNTLDWSWDSGSSSLYESNSFKKFL